jgi:hypothetical protein
MNINPVDPTFQTRSVPSTYEKEPNYLPSLSNPKAVT